MTGPLRRRRVSHRPGLGCLLALFAATGWSAGAAAAEVAPAPVAVRPPYAGAYEPQGAAEAGLWLELDQFERGLQNAPAVLRDSRLRDWVQDVLCRTVGPARCAAVRTYILQDASFNATMAPNGVLTVHTGLLARLHSDAELAAVLGHEFAHFERRHTLAAFLEARRSSDWQAWLGLLGSVAPFDTRPIRREFALGTFAFSRQQEAEADRFGAVLVRASPFRLEGAAVWRRVIEEDQTRRRARGLKPLVREAPLPTDTHPADLERVLAYAREEVLAGDRGEEGRDDYRSATGRVIEVLFDPLVRGPDFAVADYLIRGRGEALGWDARLTTLRAELFRLRGNPRDLVTARDLYRQAVASAEAPPEAWRGLGLVLARRGEEGSRPALESYLARAPAAGDAALIRQMLEN